MSAKHNATEKHKTWRLRNPTKARELHEHTSLMRRFKKYGLTLDQYHAMAERQDFCCAVCGEVPPRLIANGPCFDDYCVDHDHTTGKVRGLTCVTCNVAVGMVRNNPNKARLVAEYLERTA